jgi:hypothetical protein
MDRVDNTGASHGEFAPMDMAVRMSYARTVSHVPCGATVKFITSKIDNKSATSVAVDLGIFFHRLLFPDISGLRAGLTVQNIGAPMKYDLESFALPLNVRVGALYHLPENVAIAFDINKGLDSDLAVNLGTEYNYAFEQGVMFSARTGYGTVTKGLGFVAGLRGGIGVSYRSFGFDYAFVPLGALDNTHRVSFGYKF